MPQNNRKFQEDVTKSNKEQFLEESANAEPGNNEAEQNTKAVTGASIASDFGDVDMYTSFNELASDPDIEMTNSEIADAAINQIESDTKEVMKEIIGDDPSTSPQQDMQIARDEIGRATALREDPTKQNKLEVEGASTTTTTPDQKQEAWSKSVASEGLAKMTDEMSTFDTAVGFAAQFIPGNMTMNTAQLADEAPFLGDPEQKIRNAITGFQMLPDAQKAEAWPKLRKQVESVVGPMQARAFLTKFLDPSGAYKTQDYGTFWSAVDTVDVAATAGGLAIGVGKAFRASNYMKRLDDLGNESKGSEVATTSLVEGEGQVANKMGLQQVDMEQNASPVKASLDEAQVDMSAGVNKRLKNIHANVTKQVGRVLGGDRQPMDVSGLDAESFKNLKTKTEEAAFEQYSGTNLVVENARWEKVSESEYTLKYNVRDPRYVNNPIAGKPRPKEQSMSITLDENGQYDVAPLTLQKLTSPQAAFRKSKLGQEEVMKFAALDNVSSGMAKELTNTYLGIQKLLKKDGFRAIPKKKDRVAKVLKEGDEYTDVEGNRVGKDFSYKELKDRNLTEDEIEYYYGMRSFVDQLFGFKNKAARDELTTQGMKEIQFHTIRSSKRPGAKDSRLADVQKEADAVKSRISDDIEEIKEPRKEIGKPYDDAASAKAGVKEEGVRAFDTTQGKRRTLTNNEIDNIYAEGGQIINLRDGVKIGKQYHKHIVTKPDAVKELPAQVLRKKQGYVPASYPKGVYALQLLKKGIQDGKEGVVYSKTPNLYDNRPEAIGDYERIRQQLTEDGLLDETAGDKLVLKEPGQIQEMDLFAEPMGSSSGLYTGSRASTPPKFGSFDGQAERTDPIKAIESMLSHIAVHYPRNQSRIFMKDRLEKTARAQGIIQGNETLDTTRPITAFRGEPPKDMEAKDVIDYMERMRQQYNEWAKFHTQEENFWNKTTRQLYEWGVDSNRLSRDSKKGEVIFNLRSKDPVAAMRSFAFHAFLGYYNPAQVFVQAQAAALSFSLHPQLAPKLLRSQVGLSAAASTGHYSHVGKKLAKTWDTTQEHAEAIPDLYKRTEFDAGVTATADLNAAESGYGTGIGAIRRLQDKTLLPYREGEKFNRRYSFLTALHRWSKRNNRTDFANVTDRELQEIVDEANNFMLTMGIANRAQWQKGLLSVPTQFWQVQTKFMEELAGWKSGLTTGERSRLMMGQIGLYGAAGVPMGTAFLTQFVLPAIPGLSEADVGESEIARDALAGGAVEAMFHNVFGLEADVASRGAILSGVEDLFYSFFTDRSTPAAFLGGASASPDGGVLGRMWSESFDAADELTAMTGSKEISSGEALYSALQELGQIVSTFSNAQKAITMAQTGEIRDSYGGLITEADPGDVVAELLGFSPSDIAETYTFSARNQDIENQKSSVQKEIVKVINNYVSNPFTSKEDINARVQLLLKTLPSDKMREDVIKAIGSELSDTKSGRTKEIRDYIKARAQGATESFFSVRGSLMDTDLED